MLCEQIGKARPILRLPVHAERSRAGAASKAGVRSRQIPRSRSIFLRAPGMKRSMSSRTGWRRSEALRPRRETQRKGSGEVEKRLEEE